MANYTRSTNFTAKDALASGNPSKIILGSEHDAEYDAIATSIATKLDSNGSASNLTGLQAAQGSSLVLLNRTSASGASSVTWTNSVLSSSYERYMVVVNDLSFSTSADLWAQFSTDNGSTWIGSTSNVYARTGSLASGNGTNVVTSASTGDSKIVLGIGFTTAYRVGVNAFIDLSSSICTLMGQIMFYASAVSQGMGHNWGAVSSSSNAFRFLPSTGTFTGNFSIYGMKKS